MRGAWYFGMMILFAAATAAPSHAAGYQVKRVEARSGTITFITPQNVYVRFSNTTGISAGDTLYVERDGRRHPVMTAMYISSQSCAGPRIGNPDLKLGERVLAFAEVQESAAPGEAAGHERGSSLTEFAPVQPIVAVGPVKIRTSQRIYGGLTANSYSNFSNFTNSSDIQRWNYSLNFNADNIGGSQFYFTDYTNFSYLGGQWSSVSSNIFNSLKIYDMAVGYKSADMNAWLGRHINYHVADIGPIDGLQVEKKFGRFAVGAIAGSRPDFYDMSFNPKYPEFGGYASMVDSLPTGMMDNSIALFQQNKSSTTDRRFLYFQHSSSWMNLFNFFGSAEVDIFKLNNGAPAGDFSLTSGYLVATYTPINELSLNLSYNAQRNVIYFQTFTGSVDSFLLSENHLRQSVMLGANVRPAPYTFINVMGGYSFRSGDVSPSRNASVSVVQSQITPFELSATLSFNKILSSYLDGTIYGVRLSKYLSFNYTTISAGYSRINYVFGNGAGNQVQNEVTLEASTRILFNLFFNGYYEGIFSSVTTYGTFMGGFSYRF